MQWLLWIVPLCIAFWRLSHDGTSLMSLHKEGFDMILLFFVLLQIIIRIFVISMKYAFFSDKTWARFKGWRQTRKYIDTELITQGWINATPDVLLKEIETCLVREDVEPRFLTMLPFREMGPCARSKLTKLGHYDYTYDCFNERLEDKAEYNWQTTHKVEKINHAMFQFILKQTLDGLTDPEVVMINV